MSPGSASLKSTAAVPPAQTIFSARARVGVVIPTLNAGNRWADCLGGVKIQKLKPYRLLNIDSGSTDQTIALAKSAGFEVVPIHRHEFNHGGTRQWAIEYLRDCDLIIFLTQDAIPANCDAFEQIVRSFDDPDVAVAYGRQIPHAGATPIESHARIFNYGPETLKKDTAEAPRIGTNVFFCSNSFAAYRRSTLLELGGFRRDLILGEDMEFAARAISAGYANVYCATASVFHSHNYTVLQTLERYFDLGVFDSTNSWMRSQFGSHSSQGLRFIASELSYLLKRAPLHVPKAILQTIAKFLGYRLGLLEAALPLPLKRKLSMQPSYWK
jgi:rhamnosyltransferase